VAEQAKASNSKPALVLMFVVRDLEASELSRFRLPEKINAIEWNTVTPAPNCMQNGAQTQNVFGIGSKSLEPR
jgi:hypothetical protein